MGNMPDYALNRSREKAPRRLALPLCVGNNQEKNLPKKPDLLGSVQAMKRSAVNDLKLARKTHTPCYVVKDGKIVNAAERRKKAGQEKIAK